MSRRWRYPQSRRGVFAFPTQPLSLQQGPTWIASARRPTTRGRRGTFTRAPGTGAPPIGLAAPRRRAALRPRRGCYAEPPWQQAVPPAPPPYIPLVVKGRRGVPALRVHGRMMPGWMDLTTSPVVDGVAVLSSGSTQVAVLASSDTALITFGSDR